MLCTVDECWEFKRISGFAFVIFPLTHSGPRSLSLRLLRSIRHWYSRSIHYSTQSIGWHSIADGINTKKILYTFLHTSSSSWAAARKRPSQRRGSEETKTIKLWAGGIWLGCIACVYIFLLTHSQKFDSLKWTFTIEIFSSRSWCFVAMGALELSRVEWQHQKAII